METPSSTRSVPRSQANETEDSGICQRKKQDRSALIDITNDSPIVGLAMQTPPSGFMVKRQKSRIKNTTPGSGEALLRRQVKTLLHKVEQGTQLIHSIKTRPFIHLVTSPMRLVAPTPANTPQFPNFPDNEAQIRIASPIVAGYLRTSQVEVSEIFGEKEDKSMSITRSLLFDFTDKSASWEEEEEEEEEDDEEIVEAKEVLHLKGIPTPRGKHCRFATKEEDESLNP